MSLSQLDKEIIKQLQEDLPITSRPYLEIAKQLNIQESLLLEKLEEFINKGIIRRLGGALKHRQLGYNANAMIVWRVREEEADHIGKLIAQYSEVSHCYQRPIYPQWNYNIYSMIHGKSIKECECIAAKISRELNITDYQLLFSSREFKKSSMKYFLSK